MPFKKEIERKWLMKGRPVLYLLDQSFIRQSYIIAEDDYEVRLRGRFDYDSYYSTAPKPADYKLTIKMGNGISRDECEVKLSSETAQELSAAVRGAPITKQFCTFALPHSELKLHWNVVDPELDTGFIYAEVEFPSQAMAEKFVPTGAFAEMIEREVTGDEYYQLKNYWRRTRMNG